MCLAVPGRIVAIRSELPPGADRQRQASEPDLWRQATVDFGGVCQIVSLACLREARLGDLVLVHVGLALCRVEEPEQPGSSSPGSWPEPSLPTSSPQAGADRSSEEP